MCFLSVNTPRGAEGGPSNEDLQEITLDISQEVAEEIEFIKRSLGAANKTKAVVQSISLAFWFAWWEQWGAKTSRRGPFGEFQSTHIWLKAEREPEETKRVMMRVRKDTTKRLSQLKKFSKVEQDDLLIADIILFAGRFLRENQAGAEMCVTYEVPILGEFSLYPTKPKGAELFTN